MIPRRPRKCRTALTLWRTHHRKWTPPALQHAAVGIEFPLLFVHSGTLSLYILSTCLSFQTQFTSSSIQASSSITSSSSMHVGIFHELLVLRSNGHINVEQRSHCGELTIENRHHRHFKRAKQLARSAGAGVGAGARDDAGVGDGHDGGRYVEQTERERTSGSLSDSRGEANSVALRGITNSLSGFVGRREQCGSTLASSKRRHDCATERERMSGSVRDSSPCGEANSSAKPVSAKPVSSGRNSNDSHCANRFEVTEREQSSSGAAEFVPSLSDLGL